MINRGETERPLVCWHGRHTQTRGRRKQRERRKKWEKKGKKKKKKEERNKERKRKDQDKWKKKLKEEGKLYRQKKKGKNRSMSNIVSLVIQFILLTRSRHLVGVPYQMWLKLFIEEHIEDRSLQYITTPHPQPVKTASIERISIMFAEINRGEADRISVLGLSPHPGKRKKKRKKEK